MRRLLQVGVVLVGCLVVLAGGCGDDKDPVSPKNTAPTACFSVEPLSGTTDTLFAVDASCSTDEQDSTAVLQVRWDWENDGEWDTEWTTTKTASHQYSTTGTKTIRLQVKDTGGLTDVATRSVTVSGDSPSPPGFVRIPAGTFTMGSPTNEPGRSSNETQHQVTLTKPFYMGVHEVTQAEWVAVMGWNLSSFSGDNRPVETVTWFDCIDFCNRRSQADGLTPAYTLTNASYSGNHITSATVTWNQSANGYRLPTEAEWEYACRATSTAAFCNGGITELFCGNEPNLTQVGWYCGNSGNQTKDVGQKSPNTWGLYDMHGNVYEWCWDWYASYSGDAEDPTGPASGSDRVLRGGCWRHGAQVCRSAYRYDFSPGDRYYYLGFRGRFNDGLPFYHLTICEADWVLGRGRRGGRSPETAEARRVGGARHGGGMRLYRARRGGVT